MLNGETLRALLKDSKKIRMPQDLSNTIIEEKDVSKKEQKKRQVVVL